MRDNTETTSTAGRLLRTHPAKVPGHGRTGNQRPTERREKQLRRTPLSAPRSVRRLAGRVPTLLNGAEPRAVTRDPAPDYQGSSVIWIVPARQQIVNLNPRFTSSPPLRGIRGLAGATARPHLISRTPALGPKPPSMAACGTGKRQRSELAAELVSPCSGGTQRPRRLDPHPCGGATLGF